MTTHRDPAAQRIVFLDYLRIFAFLSVVVGHKFAGYIHLYSTTPGVHETPKALLQLLIPFIKGGGAGVVVFFLISGYIITHVLQSERPLEFAIKRIFRIYPLYVFAVLVQMLVAGQWPGWTVLIPRLLLIGDVFNTPYALDGVEWTLRLEIAFYVLMGLAKAAGLLDARRMLFPWAMIAASFTLGALGPFPSGLFVGYFTIYFPFLLLGTFFYLKAVRQIGWLLLTGFAAVVLWQYYGLVAAYQPGWIGDHFATLSVAMFLASWRLRASFVSTWLSRTLSDLTFSVYLFHNWIWAPIRGLMAPEISFSRDVLVMGTVLVVCFVANKTVERWGIRAGKRLVRSMVSRPAIVAADLPTAAPVSAVTTARVGQM